MAAFEQVQGVGGSLSVDDVRGFSKQLNELLISSFPDNSKFFTVLRRLYCPVSVRSHVY